jgi:oligopeptide/dipeptide ABC transporter ATP-binding protein
MLSCWPARLSTICKGSAKPKTVRDIVSVPAHPQHPYTQALLAAIPIVDKEYRQTRIILEGVVPSPINPPPAAASTRGASARWELFAKRKSPSS